VHDAGDVDDFVLTQEMERELLEASESAHRGEVRDMDEVLAELEAIR
jgi:hypothetical protein